MRNLLNDKITQLMMKVLSVSTSVLLMLNVPAYSQGNDEQQWWFNVELIVFKRTLQPSNTENFEHAQFDLNTADANNLLYLAALKQASPYKAINFALPFCDAKQNSHSEFAVNFDFDFVPNTKTEKFETAIVDDSQSTSMLTKETALDKNQSNDVETSVIELEVSNKVLMSNLLTPFVFPKIANKNENEDGLVLLAELQPLSNDVESNLFQSKLEALNDSVILLKHKLHQNRKAESSLRCLITKPPEPVLAQSALPTIGPILFAKTSYFNGASQIISREEMFMQEYADKVLRQRDIQALLYTAWRQKVEFGIENAEFYKVLAGNLLETAQPLSYEKWHEQYESQDTDVLQTDEEAFFEILKADLASNEKIDWLTAESISNRNVETIFETQQKYELEGQLKVYLDYVNQVPYLHIDTEFKHYQLEINSEGSSTLQSYPLKQKRRVISKQIHYFDHPAFGLIVRLERFTPPLIEAVVIENATESE